MIDAVFSKRSDGTVIWQAVPPPRRGELQAVTSDVCAAVRLVGLRPLENWSLPKFPKPIDALDRPRITPADPWRQLPR